MEKSAELTDDQISPVVDHPTTLDTKVEIVEQGKLLEKLERAEKSLEGRARDTLREFLRAFEANEAAFTPDIRKAFFGLCTVNLTR